MIKTCVVLLENWVMNYCGVHGFGALGFGLWTLDFVLCALYFVCGSVLEFYDEGFLQDTKYKVQSTKFKAQRPKAYDLRPKNAFPFL